MSAHAERHEMRLLSHQLKQEAARDTTVRGIHEALGDWVLDPACSDRTAAHAECLLHQPHTPMNLEGRCGDEHPVATAAVLLRYGRLSVYPMIYPTSG